MSGASASPGGNAAGREIDGGVGTPIAGNYTAPQTTTSGFTYRSLVRPSSAGPVLFGLPVAAAATTPVYDAESDESGSTTEVDSEEQRGRNDKIVAGMWAEESAGRAVGGEEAEAEAGEDDESVTDADSESQRGKNDAIVASWAATDINVEEVDEEEEEEEQRRRDHAIMVRWAAGIIPWAEPATIADNYTAARDFAYPASLALHTAHPLLSTAVVPRAPRAFVFAQNEEEEEEEEESEESEGSGGSEGSEGSGGSERSGESEEEDVVMGEEVVEEAEEVAEVGACKRKRGPEVLESNARVKVDGGLQGGPDRTAMRKSCFPISSLVKRRVTKLNLGGRKPAGLIPDRFAGVILAPPNDKAAMSDPEKRSGVDHMRPRLGFAADGRLYPAVAVPVQRPSGVERILNRVEERVTRARRTSLWVNSGGHSGASSEPWTDVGSAKGRTGRVRGARVEKSSRFTPARRFEPTGYPHREIGESHLEGLRGYVTSRFGKSPAIMKGTNVLSGVSLLFSF